MDIQPVRIMCSFHVRRTEGRYVIDGTQDIKFFSSLQESLSKSITPKKEEEVAVQQSPAMQRLSSFGGTSNNQKLFYIEYQRDLARSRYNEIINSPQPNRGNQLTSHVRSSSMDLCHRRVYSSNQVMVNSSGMRLTLINDSDGVLSPIADITASRCKVDVTEVRGGGYVC